MHINMMSFHYSKNAQLLHMQNVKKSTKKLECTSFHKFGHSFVCEREREWRVKYRAKESEKGRKKEEKRNKARQVYKRHL